MKTLLLLLMLIFAGGGDTMRSLYEDLGVEKTATAEQIKAAHRKAVRAHHPDKGGCREKFQRVQHAYEVLSDLEKRRRYDETGDDGSATAGPSPEHLIASAWMAVIEQCDPECDLIAVLRETIRDAARRADASAAAAEKQRAKFAMILGRLNVGQDSVLRGVLETKCAAQKLACEQHQQAAALLNESVKLLDGASYRHEPFMRQRPRDDFGSMVMDEILRSMGGTKERRRREGRGWHDDTTSTFGGMS